jgi:hypothetical protein
MPHFTKNDEIWCYVSKISCFLLLFCDINLVMKEQMKSKKKLILGIILVAIAFAAVGLGVGIGIKNNQTEQLVVTADDITIYKDDSAEIVYKTSIAKSVITFKVLDKTIATVTSGVIYGVEVGETKLIITARYESLVYEKRVAVKVIEPEEDNDKDPPKTSEDVDDGSIVVDSFRNCTCEGRNVTAALNEVAYLTFERNDNGSDWRVESNSESLSASMATAMDRTVQIKGTAVGKYKITVYVGGRKAEFTVTVE